MPSSTRTTPAVPSRVDDPCTAECRLFRRLTKHDAFRAGGAGSIGLTYLLFTVDVIPLSMWLFQISSSPDPSILRSSTLVILLSSPRLEASRRLTGHEMPRAMNESAAGDAFRTVKSLATASGGETSLRYWGDLYLVSSGSWPESFHAFVSVFERDARLCRGAGQGAAAHPVGTLHGIPVPSRTLFDTRPHNLGRAPSLGVRAPPRRPPFPSQRLASAGMIVPARPDGRFASGCCGNESRPGTRLEPWAMRVPSGTGLVLLADLPVAFASCVAPSALVILHFLSRQYPGLLLRPRLGSYLARRHRSRRGVSSFLLPRPRRSARPISVRDAALLVDAMEGFDSRDEVTSRGRRLNVLEILELGIEACASAGWTSK